MREPCRNFLAETLADLETAYTLAERGYDPIARLGRPAAPPQADLLEMRRT